jgi:hypothetical protein
MQSGTGYGAVNVLLPQEVQSQLAEADLAKTRASLARELAPIQAQTSQLALEDARLNNQVKTRATRQALIANAAALATTAEDWDAAMKDLAASGITEAGQFVGRFNERLRQRIASAYSAPSATSALAGMSDEVGDTSGLAQMGRGAGGRGPGGATSGLLGAGDMRATYYGMSPDHRAQVADNLQKMADALEQVETSPNPSATWDQLAAQLGHSHEVGQYSPEKLAQAKAEIMPHLQYLQQRGRMAQAGVPDVGPPPEVDNVGGQLVEIDRSDPRNPKVTPLTERPNKYQLVGTDENGRGVYVDTATGKEISGSTKLGAKPGGAGGRGSVFEAKRQAWLDAHPGDAQGALDYANSLMGKQLTPAAAMKAAAAQANRDYQAEVLAGTPIADPDAYMRQKTQEYYNDFVETPQATPNRQPAGAGAGGYTPAQVQAKKRYAGSKAQAGTQANPYVPTTEAQYTKLPPGAYYLYVDGRVYQKPKGK